MKIIRPTKGKIIENKKICHRRFSNARNGLPIFHRISEERVSPGNEIVSKDQQEKILKKWNFIK